MRYTLTFAAIISSPLPLLAAPPFSPDITAADRAIIADDPPFQAEPMTITRPARTAGPSRSLFNGRNLNGWDTWLGHPDPAAPQAMKAPQPIGRNRDPGHVFSVVQEDGAPAIFISGKTWGGIISHADLRNYHLRVEYKWGKHSWPPRTGQPANTGILYHSYGPYGEMVGNWMSSAEFEIMQGSTGQFVTVGYVGARIGVGHDGSTPYPSRRYMASGRFADVSYPAMKVNPAIDAERPSGEWNTLDIYVVGASAIHVVNGRPVLRVDKLTMRDGKTPLTHGQIQIQSEGSEVFFRAITIQPITNLPVLTSKTPD